MPICFSGALVRCERLGTTRCAGVAYRAWKNRIRWLISKQLGISLVADSCDWGYTGIITSQRIPMEDQGTRLEGRSQPGYTMKLLDRLRSGQLRLLPVLFGSVVLVAFAAWLAFALLRSLPRRTVVMAVYPEGSLNVELVKRYREVLARDGIDLKLAPSAGAVESLAQLRDPKSATTVALIPGGITTEQESPQLVSLGTVFYQPMWVFARRDILHGRHHPRNLRISIGPEGSSSHELSLKLLGRSGVIDAKSASILPLTPSESTDKLISGEIDAAIFLDGWESPAVQRLVNDKHINLESIRRADAFDALYPYLDKLILPAGVVDMIRPDPPADVQLIATKSSLVVRRDLQPAIQYMLLEAAVEIHSPPGMFRTAGQFPDPRVNRPAA